MESDCSCARQNRFDKNCTFGRVLQNFYSDIDRLENGQSKRDSSKESWIQSELSFFTHFSHISYYSYKVDITPMHLDK